MKKLKVFVVIVITLIITACGGSGDQYVVSGTVPEGIADGDNVFMLDINSGNIIDSAVINKKKFYFKVTSDDKLAVILYVERKSAFFDIDETLSEDEFRNVYRASTVNLIIDTKSISVDLSDPRGVIGSPMTKIFYDFLTESEDLVSEARGKLIKLEMGSDDEREKIIDELFEKMDKVPLKYLKEHPDDLLGAMIFYTWMQNQMEPSAVKFNEYSALVGEFVLNFGPIKEMKDYFSKTGRAEIGQPFIDFTIENGNVDGTAVSFSDYVGKGKYVLVDFWASWCAPCRAEIPVLKEVYNKYKGDNFELLGVAVWDQRDASIQSLKEDGNTWPQILDAQKIPTDLYGIQGIPHIILFGPDGTIVARNLRGAKLKEKLAELL